jgi:protein-disulfide isomerase
MRERKMKLLIALLAAVAVLTGCIGDDAPAPKNITNWTNLADQGASIGPEGAKVTVVEFSDFECPFCARFHKNTMPQIKERYIDSGKVRLVFRNYPLEIHASAVLAAQAVECAGGQGRFWQMADKAFDNQADLSKEKFKTWAADLGVEGEAFNQCIETDMTLSKVRKDMKDADDAGVRSVPTFYINGRVVEGAQEYEVFERIIDEELAK